MKKLVSDSIRDLTILSVASLVLGILLLFFPNTSGLIICRICALALIVFGALHVVLYFVRDLSANIFRHDLAIGIVCLLVGVYLFLRPQILMSVLPAVLGLALLADSFLRLQKAFDLVRMHESHWWVVLLLAVATGIFGIVILANPFAAASALLMFIGIGLLVNGFSDLWTLRTVRHHLKDAAQKFEDAVHGVETTGYVVEDDDDEHQN